MEFINYFFASLISFSGLIIGISLIKIALEEQKPFEKKFSLLRKLFLFLIFILVMFFYYSNIFYLLTLVACVIFLIVLEYKIDDLFKKSIVAYAILGILFFVSSKNLNIFLIESSLILLYGLPTASLLYKINEKNHYKIFFCNIGFILIANLLYFL